MKHYFSQITKLIESINMSEFGDQVKNFLCYVKVSTGKSKGIKWKVYRTSKIKVATMVQLITQFNQLTNNMNPFKN
ncbi:unnamed protein product [Hymenolepis diminuta]|uniref:Uncharacterized protein n=1 Tax=Hymenolepis diminuta TaxID=6216 RepID=A0A564XVV8_HYMDI|nr:unnamed protein product [Hymenolepis diminuta]